MRKNISLFIPVIFPLMFITAEAAQKPEWLSQSQMTVRAVPVIPGKGICLPLKLSFMADSGRIIPDIVKLEARLLGNAVTLNIDSVTAGRCNSKGEDFTPSLTLKGRPGKTTLLEGRIRVSQGLNNLFVGFEAKGCAGPSDSFTVGEVKLFFSDGTTCIFRPGNENSVVRFATLLRHRGQDGADTYRIPGLVTTSKGTLIAVYDVRYRDSRDLQGDIDVGMSRSTDGGRTWEPMKIIMNMDCWGGKPEDENGVGDPSVLVDDVTGTVWVAALWVHGSPGRAAWNSSGPGLKPGETGQILLVKSDDDGMTWSDEINITSEVKNPSWRLMLQGPGRGITMRDGTLVFPAQFKDSTDIPFSSMIASADRGRTWFGSNGARENTTEAQVVELKDGSLMINMRDNRNGAIQDETNGRAVSVTHDLGMTWERHPSSNCALPEPVCMASLISTDSADFHGRKRLLIFSNPADTRTRTHITVKISDDEGLTWPDKWQTELYEPEGYGYSCLTVIDRRTLGIIYEGKGDLYFQAVPLK